MAHIDSPRRWYLFDYGNVISTAPTPQDWDLLAEATGTHGLQDAGSAYWQHRYAYDAGTLTSEEYWSLVCGERVEHVRSAWLDVLDGNQWSHPNLEILDVLEDLDARGEQLALLSNMPAAMVSQLSHAPWTRLFKHLFFSSTLRLVKPSPAVYEQVLAELGVDGPQVIFIDDAPANVAAARALGIDARLFDPSTDVSRVLTQPGQAPVAGAHG
ncbi:HAD-IA family hydrolase [Arthrobacter agilis]|uniref:HAD-IA family hydrolase n=1 Tax=Arthrobacter agilis TaxID=37921 RepID=UPI00278A95AA|nr:HAD-IA family hydrolase [Arthrobacter agilis]MDQ0735396.1 putative hydrolase of the HAD superfamily [Arthrobacter agilis]